MFDVRFQGKHSVITQPVISISLGYRWKSIEQPFPFLIFIFYIAMR